MAETGAGPGVPGADQGQGVGAGPNSAANLCLRRHAQTTIQHSISIPYHTVYSLNGFTKIFILHSSIEFRVIILVVHPNVISSSNVSSVQGRIMILE